MGIRIFNLTLPISRLPSSSLYPTKMNPWCSLLPNHGCKLSFQLVLLCSLVNKDFLWIWNTNYQQGFTSSNLFCLFFGSVWCIARYHNITKTNSADKSSSLEKNVNTFGKLTTTTKKIAVSLTFKIQWNLDNKDMKGTCHSVHIIRVSVSQDNKGLSEKT